MKQCLRLPVVVAMPENQRNHAYETSHGACEQTFKGLRTMVQSLSELRWAASTRPRLLSEMLKTRSPMATMGSCEYTYSPLRAAPV